MSPVESLKRMPLAYGFFTIATVITCLASYVAIIVYGVESVLGTGPIIFTLGVVVLHLGTKHRHPPGIRFGYFIILSVFCLLLLVWIADWGPRDARTPLLILGAIFVVSVFVLSNRSFASAPNYYKEWQCQQCGYPLYGLQSLHCPECGSNLDIELVAKYKNQEPTQI